MPCCLTILTYGCGHKQLWKAHCSNACYNIPCPPPKQEILARLAYRWSCEDCHTRTWNERQQRYTDAVDEKEKAIMERKDLDEDQKLAFVDSLRAREDWDDARAEHTRTQQVEEIQWVADFAEKYGQLMWHLKYGAEGAIGPVAERLDLMLWAKFSDVAIVRDICRDKVVMARLCRYRLSLNRICDTTVSTHRPPPPTPPRFTSTPPPLTPRASHSSAPPTPPHSPSENSEVLSTDDRSPNSPHPSKRQRISIQSHLPRQRHADIITTCSTQDGPSYQQLP